MEGDKIAAKPGRFERFIGALIRLFPLLGIFWVGTLGTFLALTFAGKGQFVWSFSTFLLVTVFLLVATLLRPLEASSFELAWTGLLRLLVTFNPKPQIEEALKALPAETNLEQIKPVIVESVAQATHGVLKEVVVKLEKVLAEAQKQSTFSFSDWRPSTTWALRSSAPVSIEDISKILSTPLREIELPKTLTITPPSKVVITDVSGKQALGEEKAEKKAPPTKP